MSSDSLSASALSPLAWALLSFLGQLSPDHPFPAALLAGAEVELRQEDGLEASPLGTPVAELQRVGLLDREPGGDSFGLTSAGRQMVAAAAAETCEMPGEPRTERSLRILVEVVPEDFEDPRHWPLWELLRPHAAHLLELAEDHPATPAFVELSNRLALVELVVHRDYSESERLFRWAISAAEAWVAEDPASGEGNDALDASCSNLGALFLESGRFSEAEEIWRKVLRRQEKRRGRDYSGPATTLNKLAAVFWSLDC